MTSHTITSVQKRNGQSNRKKWDLWGKTVWFGQKKGSDEANERAGGKIKRFKKPKEGLRRWELLVKKKQNNNRRKGVSKSFRNTQL